MIYLDYNATTPLCDAARDAMLPYLERRFGNPSSVHAAGREARAAIDNARDKLAALLHAKPNEIIFTSGGTESCNLAVFGLARRRSAGGGHIISAKTEHHAVLNTVEHLEKNENFQVTWLDVSRDGAIDPDQLASAIRPETRLVSIMTANNETGVLQPMREISQICRERGVLLHTDMVQAFGKVSVDLSLVDAASFAAHKFYGPKGAGFLFLQEREARLRDELWTRISENVPDAKQNCANARRLANTLNVSLLGLDSEMLLIALDLEGVCASSGSACMVGSVVASHVLLAMGLPIERARSAVRFSLGKWTTADEIKAAGDAVQKIVERLQTRKSAYAVA